MFYVSRSFRHAEPPLVGEQLYRWTIHRLMMPPKSMLDESKYSCPNCGCQETYVHKKNDRFLCAECDFSAPIGQIVDR